MTCQAGHTPPLQYSLVFGQVHVFMVGRHFTLVSLEWRWHRGSRRQPGRRYLYVPTCTYLGWMDTELIENLLESCPLGKFTVWLCELPIYDHHSIGMGCLRTPTEDGIPIHAVVCTPNKAAPTLKLLSDREFIRAMEECPALSVIPGAHSRRSPSTLQVMIEANKISTYLGMYCRLPTLDAQDPHKCHQIGLLAFQG